MNYLQLGVLSLIVSLFSASVSLPVTAETIPVKNGTAFLKENHSVKTVKEWLAQVEETKSQSPIQVIGVKLNQTKTGLEIVLETQDGKPLQVDASKFRTEGNSLIADIPNALLALPNERSFAATNPAKDVTNISVTQLDSTSIRVNVTGAKAPPTTEVVLKVGGLAYSLNQDDEADEEIVVRGDRAPYTVPDVTTATKTDTPARDIPATIDVIPRQLIEDRQVTRLQQATDTVPGVQSNFGYGGLSGANLYIRGFPTSFTTYRDGFRDFGFLSPVDVAGIERVEILKGPASVLYGENEPGGVVNIVSKMPLFRPRYEASFAIGNFDMYRATADLTGPLNPEKTVAYRLNVAHENTGSFRDFNSFVSYFVAPVFTWQITKNTKITFNFHFQNLNYTHDRNLPAEPESLLVPIGRFLGEPGFNDATVNSGRATYVLEHKFSDNWKFRQGFAAILSHIRVAELATNSLLDDRQTIDRYASKSDEFSSNYTIQAELLGKFNTGSVQHQILFGAEFYRQRFQYDFFGDPEFGFGTAIDPINLFNPIYGAKPGEFKAAVFGNEYGTDTLGFYIQDQITLLKNLKLLVGGRFDIARVMNFDRVTNEQLLDTTKTAFSPRVGIVYQPIEPISLYFSYSKSFNPVLFGISATGEPFLPEGGEQYEVGVKADLIPNRLFTTLSFYKIAKQNVLVTDPEDDRFSIQTGEQQSRGIEFSLTGALVPGWNIAAGYAYTNAFISEDTTLPVDDRLAGIPKHQFGLWTSYEIQRGKLKGLGAGLGLYYVGEREAQLPNTDLALPSYFRVDASIFYRWSNWKIQFNATNLTNVEYYNTYGGGAIIPQAPLTVIGKISVEF